MQLYAKSGWTLADKLLLDGSGHKLVPAIAMRSYTLSSSHLIITPELLRGLIPRIPRLCILFLRGTFDLYRPTLHYID